MIRIFRLPLAATLFAAGFLPLVAHAQLPNNWIGVGTSNWNVPANWMANDGSHALPDGPGFDEFASINGNASVFVDSTITPHPGEVRLGALGGTNNVLEIRSGGNLRVEKVDPTAGLLTNGGVHMLGFAGSGNNGTLRVLPGGTITIDGVLDTVPDLKNVVTVGALSGSAATMNVGALSLRGTSTFFANAAVTVTGNATGFNPALTGDVAFDPLSNTTFVINSAQNATINAVGTASLAGPLSLQFNAFAPTAGQSWTLIKAADISGSFSSVSTPSTLGAGQQLTLKTASVVGGKQLTATVSTVLVLNVNRDTGTTSLSNPNAPGIAFDGYSIKSASGRLTSVGWNSLDDQNALGGDWRESNVSNTQLAELKPTVTGTIGANGSQGIGNAYSAFGGSFGTPEDLTVDYTLSDGSVVQGIVNYTGTKVNNLLLQVDPTTGQAKLRNTSLTTVSIDGYDIASATSSLSTSSWNSLDDQNAAGGDWRESDASAAHLAELKPTTSTTLAPGASFLLGSPFNPLGTKDLMFSFLQAGNSAATTGAVIYAPLGVPGDYDGDGIVDASDYTVFRDHLNQSFALANRDPNNSGLINAGDFTYWKSHFGATSGSGSASLSGGSVPEPTSWLLLAIGGACVLILRQRNQTA